MLQGCSPKCIIPKSSKKRVRPLLCTSLVPHLRYMRYKRKCSSLLRYKFIYTYNCFISLHMNTNARSRLLDTGRVLSFRFSQPSVRAGSPCDRSLSHSRGGYFVANETPGSRAGCPVRDNPPTWVESQSGRSCRARPPSLTEVIMQGQLI